MIKHIIHLLLLICLVVALFTVTDRYFANTNRGMVLGASFHEDYAAYLGLDPKETLNTILTDYGFRYIRLNADWDKTEPAPNQYDFSHIDWQVQLASDADAKIILAVGQKTPRWPECYAPKWAVSLNDEQYFSALNNYVYAVVDRYRNNPAVEMYQIENEPFLAFGEKCRSLPRMQLDKEIALARGTEKPVLVTDSGELSTWRKTARVADYFGTTLYRVVWNQYTKYWYYDWLPASFYRFKLWINGRAVASSFVAELQAEPWLPNVDISVVTKEEMNRSMNVSRLEKHIAVAQAIGVSRSYLWGAEWWVWMEKNGDDSFAQYLRRAVGKQY